MKKIFIIALFVLLFLGYSQYNGYQKFLQAEIEIENDILEVPKGAIPSLYLVDEFGLDKNYVRVYFKLNDVDARLEAGKFKMTSPVTIQNFFEKLNNPIIEGDVDLVVIEGNTIYDIDYCISSPSDMQSSNGGKKGCIFDRTGENERVISESFAQPGEFIQYTQSQETVDTLAQTYTFLQGAETLEGFLHPDSYKINKNTFSVEGLVIKMLDNFERKVMRDEDLLAEFGNSLPRAVAENIILASVVEKEIANPEAREDDEAEKVAGVLKKRFEENWQIGADATVCYPYKILSKDCTPSFVLEKLYDITEYNTRQMVGLPKTPIANPYAGTIKSTLLSKESEYYFYLHAPNGKIYYGRTNAEHEANKTQYLR